MYSWEILFLCHCRGAESRAGANALFTCAHQPTRSQVYGSSSRDSFSNPLTGTQRLIRLCCCGYRDTWIPHYFSKVQRLKKWFDVVPDSWGFHSLLNSPLLQITIKAGTVVADNLRTGILKSKMNSSGESCHLYSRVRSFRRFLQLKAFLSARKSWHV